MLSVPPAKPNDKSAAKLSGGNTALSILEESDPIEEVDEINNFKNKCKKENNIRWVHSKYASDSVRIALNKTMSIGAFHLDHDVIYIEPWMILVAQCTVADVKFGFGDYEFSSLSKEDFSLVVIFTDILCIIIILVFVLFLEKR